jgi:hypothetical protein
MHLNPSVGARNRPVARLQYLDLQAAVQGDDARATTVGVAIGETLLGVEVRQQNAILDLLRGQAAGPGDQEHGHQRKKTENDNT